MRPPMVFVAIQIQRALWFLTVGPVRALCVPCACPVKTQGIHQSLGFGGFQGRWAPFDEVQDEAAGP